MTFVNLPPVPMDVTPALRDQLETYRTEYFAEEPARYERAFTIAEELATFQPASVADLAAKLILAVHQLAPGNQHDTLFNVDRDDIPADLAAALLLACVDDAIRLAGSASERDTTSFIASVATDLRRLGDC